MFQTYEKNEVCSNCDVLIPSEQGNVSNIAFCAGCFVAVVLIPSEQGNVSNR